MAKFTLNVNGKSHNIDADPDMPLLYALRNDVGLNNPHFGCSPNAAPARCISTGSRSVPVSPRCRRSEPPRS